MKYLFVLSSLFFLISCNNAIDKKYNASIPASENIEYIMSNEHPGKKLMETNCFACHNPTTSEADRIAPPMIAIKKHYISENTTKEEFTNAMLNWTKEPSEEKSKMPGAVRRFKVMPYQSFPEQTIREIADYIFDNEIEQPDWFEEHFQKGMRNRMGNGKGMGRGRGMQQSSPDTFSTSEDRGLHYARTTMSELGKNLMGTIQKKGVIPALEFCKIKAIPLTDSMATVHNAIINRVSDKPRNPKNKASILELQYLDIFKNQVTAGKEVEPIINKQGNDVQFYYPIITNTLCLQCHGTPNKEIASITLKKINDLYPNDAATGYTENEVRGMWSIRFTEN
jgi:cytochrome c2/uncharacterized protein YnzC (UPF0291/DUF896 family)